MSFTPGCAFEGEICFASGHDVRGVVKAKSAMTPIHSFQGLESLDALCAAYANLLSRQPWLSEVAFPLKAVIPSRRDDRWELSDAHGQSFPLMCTDAIGWLLTAVSGGAEVDVVAAFDGTRPRPLAVIAGGEYVPLTQANALVD